MDQKELWGYVFPRFCDYFIQNPTNQLLTEFVGVTSPTLLRWTADSGPVGGNLLRLWIFLAAAGVPSPELQLLPEFNRVVAELYAYSLITIDEAEEICGLANQQGTHRAMRGSTLTKPSLTVEELLELHGPELAKAKTALSERLSLSAVQSQARSEKAPEPRIGSPPPQLVPLVAPSNEISNILLLATLLNAALPLARHVNSDNCSPADRERLRALMGQDGVFELSNHLNALCSERARRQTR